MMTIVEFGRRLRARDITSEQVTEACLAAIDADNPRLNAFILVMADEARQARGRRTRSSRPDAIAGRCTACPSRSRICSTSAACRRRRRRACARATSPITTRRRSRTSRQAGAVFIGKTNLHEFAFGTTNEDSAFGPARNPHDPDAIARRIERRLGRQRRRRHGARHDRHRHRRLDPDSRRRLRHRRTQADARRDLDRRRRAAVATLDHVGPLARTVADAALVYRALLGDRGRGRSGADAAQPDCASAVPRRYFCDLLDDEVRARFEEALERLRAAGARIDDIDDPARG